MSNSHDRIRSDIVDNTKNTTTMQKILNSEIPRVKQFDISTGYFDVQGYGMLRESIEVSVKDETFIMRLLMGKEAILFTKSSFEKYAQQYKEIRTDNKDMLSMKESLDETDFTMESKTQTTSLIDLLKLQNVHVRLGKNRFNHSKCYILGNDSAFIGSSNFTHGGMTENYELNAGLYQPGAIRQTRQWFNHMWEDAVDIKDDLINVLMQSKFGTPSLPFDVYMKILFEQFNPTLPEIDLDTKNSEMLTKFQQDAVRTGMFIISNFGGTIIADATGLGKTNMGIELVRQKILKEGKKVLLIAPNQVLHSMWKEKLKDVDIHIREMLSMESLGRDSILKNLGKYRKIDMVLIDESQNFRSKNTNRRNNLMKLLSMGKRKQMVLLSATPINNSIMDLYYQLSIITGGDDSYFYHSIGIPDLYGHMRDAANKEGLQLGLEKIQQLLDRVMVRRTRSYIKDVYKDDLINGMPIKFPKHEYASIRYSLSDLFGNIFEKILENINMLTMVPYGIEQYNTTLSVEEKNKHIVRAHLQVILLLKRFESSIEAIRISLERKINLYKHIRSVLDEGKILRVRDYNRVMAKWSSAEEGGDPDLDIDEKDKAEFFISEIAKIEKDDVKKDYDVTGLKNDMDNDLKILEGLLEEVKKITIDTKLDAVEQTIFKENALTNESKKVLIFTEYTATAKYITKDLKAKFKDKNIQCITGNTEQDTRKQYIKLFAPESNPSEDDILKSDEIDILVSTEVLSEGQNLQDCNYIVNYDLPWNPMKIVQRTGRIDRLTSKYDVIHSRACYPDKELDGIITLMAKLINKIGVVDKIIGLDSEVLGEVPTPKQFNGNIKQRIKVLARKDGDADKIISNMERDSDIMLQSSPINELSRYIKEKGIDFMKEVPIGRRSGKKGEKPQVVLAYLQEKSEHRVHFVTYDFKNDTVQVNDGNSDVINTVSCMVDEPIYLPMDSEDNHESFELLLEIDQKARVSIEEHNNKVINGNELKNRKNKYEKNVTRIKQIITKEVMEGQVTTDDGESVMEVIKSEYLIPWENSIEDMLAEYDRTNDVKSLIASIINLGKWIGLENKPKPTEFTEPTVTSSDLKLVGAMFIMGEKFDPNFGRTGLNKKY